MNARVADAKLGGAFTPALDDYAKKNGWTVVSMKDDWKQVFRHHRRLSNHRNCLTLDPPPPMGKPCSLCENIFLFSTCPPLPQKPRFHEPPATFHTNTIVFSQIEEIPSDPFPVLPAMAFRRLWL